MVKKELYVPVPVPSLFRCPISLEVMKSPVSLSTGVTYDRSSIQRWLDSGNNTCPATMQLLQSKDLVPNHTLHRLIQIWSHNNKFHSVSSTEVLHLMSKVTGSNPGEVKLESFIKILFFATEAPGNRKLVAGNKEFVVRLVDILAEGSDLNPNLLETLLKLLQLIATAIDNNNQKHKLLFHTNPNLFPNLVKIFQTGRSDSRVAIARFIESVVVEPETKKIVLENRDFLSLLRETLRRNAVEFAAEESEITAVLSCLKTLVSPRQNKLKIIEAGFVPIITNMLTKSDEINNNSTRIELLITIMEMLVGCTEGRTAITENPNCIPSIVQKLMKASTAANEHAVAVLWSLCHLFRDTKARELMTKSNGGLTKILLLMQSDCSPAVKRMCCDLIRVFRVSSKSCLSCYDSKTTHIMPC